MALLVAEYDALMEAKSQNEWLMEQLRLLKKKQSGASSEQTKEPLDGQMSLLFHEAEAYTAPPGPQETTQVAAHTRKQSGSVKDAVPDNIPGPDRDAHFRHCSPASQLCRINGTGEHPPASCERHRGGESQRRPVRTKADGHACGLQQPCGKMGRGDRFARARRRRGSKYPTIHFKIRPDACRRVKGREEKTKKAGTKVIDFYPKSAG